MLELQAMDAQDALHKTLKDFKLKANELAALSGVPAEDISRFRHKRKDMYVANLAKIVAALPEDARFYFLGLWSRGDEVALMPSPKVQDSGTPYKVDVPPSPFAAFVWEWLSRNRIPAKHLEAQLESMYNFSAKSFREILGGRRPTDLELGYLGSILRTAEGHVLALNELQNIRDGVEK